MDRTLWKILILLQIVGLTLGSREFILDKEAIFTECLDPPPGAKGFDHLADISQLTSTRIKDGLHISGNLTTKWDIGQNDRIEVDIAVLKMDGGKWTPTPLVANIKDFCKEMYDKNALHYPYSTKYFANKADIKDKCITHKGTKILLEPFDLKVVLSIVVPMRPGPHRVIVKFTAVNNAGVPNPNSICIEVAGKLL